MKQNNKKILSDKCFLKNLTICTKARFQRAKMSRGKNSRTKQALPAFQQQPAKDTEECEQKSPSEGWRPISTCLSRNEIRSDTYHYFQRAFIEANYDNNLHLKLLCHLKSTAHSLVHLLLLIMLRRRMCHHFSTCFQMGKTRQKVRQLARCYVAHKQQASAAAKPHQF